MISKFYKIIVRMLLKTHLLIIDPGDEEEDERFFEWLYPDD